MAFASDKAKNSASYFSVVGNYMSTLYFLLFSFPPSHPDAVPLPRASPPFTYTDYCTLTSRLPLEPGTALNAADERRRRDARCQQTLPTSAADDPVYDGRRWHRRRMRWQ